MLDALIRTLTETGTQGPTTAQSSSRPTSLAEPTTPAEDSDPAWAEAVETWEAGVESIQASLTRMVSGFEKAATHSRYGSESARIVRGLKVLLPLVAAHSEGVRRILSKKEGAHRDTLADLRAVLDEEPLTRAPDDPLSSEPRRATDRVVKTMTAEVLAALSGMAESVDKLGWKLQGAVTTATRPDAVKRCILALSAAKQALVLARQKIAAEELTSSSK